MTIIYKYMAYVLVIVMLTAYAGFFGYEKGREIERVEWLAERDKQEAKAANMKEASEAEIAKEKLAYETNFMRIINEKQRLQADLNKRMHGLSVSGLWIKSSEACSGGGGVSGEAKGASGNDSSVRPNKIRLPRETEQGVLEIGYDAKELVNKYNTLRGICLPLVEVIY